jgi:hypothetical protein
MEGTADATTLLSRPILQKPFVVATDLRHGCYKRQFPQLQARLPSPAVRWLIFFAATFLCFFTTSFTDLHHMNIFLLQSFCRFAPYTYVDLYGANLLKLSVDRWFLEPKSLGLMHLNWEVGEILWSR